MTADSKSTDTKPVAVKLRDVGEFVNRKIGSLQARYLASGSTARAELAQLRHAVGKPVGSVPTVWDLTLQGVPGTDNWTSDRPTRNEIASHLTMTLYATHQQSKSIGMHRRGWGVGRSTRLLADRSHSGDAVRRRFEVLGTSESIEEVSIHARGLVGQLRASDIPLDYGLLADQLVSMQFPEGFNRVRLQWGRDFYRYVGGDSAQASNQTNEETQ